MFCMMNVVWEVAEIHVSNLIHRNRNDNNNDDNQQISFIIMFRCQYILFTAKTSVLLIQVQTSGAMLNMTEI